MKYLVCYWLSAALQWTTQFRNMCLGPSRSYSMVIVCGVHILRFLGEEFGDISFILFGGRVKRDNKNFLKFSLSFFEKRLLILVHFRN
jgi:hypothetical protein